MKTKDIISKSSKPAIYEKGTAFMWTDKHIAAQLLNIHLNPDIDLASRKRSTIEKTAAWILDTQKGKEKLNILDLGCGPGLYAEIFAGKGHSVTGVDISETSIEHAKKSTQDKGLGISYINASYLNLDLEAEQFDLVTLIYTDFGVLNPEEQKQLLQTIYKVLKKGGTFIFDVMKDTELENRVSPNTWETAESGFWKAMPYLLLSQSFLYEKEKVVLFQHIVTDEKEQTDIFRFWTHFFSQEDIAKQLTAQGFTNLRFNDQILPTGDIWNGDNVLFTVAEK
mgnify:CR=1 FL=1